MTSEDRVTQRRRAGQWLREQRERAGFASAAELGRAIGATKEVIWSYEAGRSSVPDDRAESIAEALKLDVITTRRGLGLWVPKDDHQDDPMNRAEVQQNEPLDEEGLAARMPPAMRRALQGGDEVTDFRMLDVSTPGADEKIFIAWTGPPPEDMDRIRELYQQHALQEAALQAAIAAQDRWDAEEAAAIERFSADAPSGDAADKGEAEE